MERPVPQVPGHTAYTLIGSTTGAAIGVAFIRKDQEVEGLDYPGSVKVERLDSPGSVIEGQGRSHLPRATVFQTDSMGNAVEDKGGKISPDIFMENFPGSAVEGEARMLDSSPSASMEDSLPDISLDASLKTGEEGEGQNIDPPLVTISSDDSAPFLPIRDTSSSSGLQVLSSDQNQKIKFRPSRSMKEAVNDEVKILVKQMADEMLSSVKHSQNQTKTLAANGGKAISTIYHEYITDSLEIDLNRLNKDGKLNRFRKVKCKLCKGSVLVSWANFSAHMRKFHLPEETCHSCGDDIPARDVSSHKKKCSQRDGDVTAAEEPLGKKDILKKLQNEMIVFDKAEDIVGDKNSLTLSEPRDPVPEVSSAVKGCSGADMIGIVALMGSPESQDSLVKLQNEALVSDKSKTIDSDKYSLISSEPGDYVLKGTSGVEVASGATTLGSKASKGGSEAVIGNPGALVVGSGALLGELSATVGIQMMVGNKVFNLVVARRKPIKKAMKKMAIRLGQEVGRLSFTMEGGKRLQGQEVMGDLEGKVIVVT